MTVVKKVLAIWVLITSDSISRQMENEDTRKVRIPGRKPEVLASPAVSITTTTKYGLAHSEVRRGS